MAIKVLSNAALRKYTNKSLFPFHIALDSRQKCNIASSVATYRAALRLTAVNHVHSGNTALEQVRPEKVAKREDIPCVDTRSTEFGGDCSVHLRNELRDRRAFASNSKVGQKFSSDGNRICDIKCTKNYMNLGVKDSFSCRGIPERIPLCASVVALNGNVTCNIDSAR